MATANSYQDKMGEYVESIKNLMYTFEVTKCCGYSTFITVYKDESLLDLYNRIALHFGGIEIDDLFFIDTNGEKIKIPLSKKLIFQFVREQTISRPIRWTPVYPVPCPVVYRVFLDDGHCHDECYNHIRTGVN